MKHALHLVGELLLGVLVVAVLATCALAWRLAQGPLDVTALLQREQARLSIPGATLHFGHASLAWEGSTLTDQRLDIGLGDVSLAAPGDGPRADVRLARIGLPIRRLLQGRIAPHGIVAEGVRVSLTRRADGAFSLGGQSGGEQERLAEPLWPPDLRRLTVTDAAITIHDAALGTDWRVQHVALALRRAPAGGVAGEAHAVLAAGDVRCALDARLSSAGGGTHGAFDLAPVDPAALAAAAPGLGALRAVDAPVTLTGGIELDAALRPLAGTLTVTAGPGRFIADQGTVALQAASARLSATPDRLRVEDARIQLADLPGRPPAPRLAATGEAARSAGRIRAQFALDLDGVAMADLDRYWPAGVGGGARPWLVRNVTAGRLHDGRVSGSLEAPSADPSDVTLTALAGGAAVDDATIWWLRPIPPVVRAAGRVVVEGPDAVRVTLDRASQDRLAVTAGSYIDVNRLQAPHQFGDVSVGLSGPLADALALLDHPRLKLLSRGHVDVVDPAGTVGARLDLRIPLEDRLSVDDIAIRGKATLEGVHLGRVVGGRDLDQASLKLDVDGDGLKLAGTGAVSGIQAALGLDMDFRAGPPRQVLQHLTADGRATGAQLASAGVPANLAALVAGGSTGLHIDYTGWRDGTAAIQVDANLAQAVLATPVGWSKPAGPDAQAGARVLLDHGRLAGVEGLHAEGPDLAIASHGELAPGQPRVLVLERFHLGRTDAHGRVTFPGRPKAPLVVRLSGATLDLSAYIQRPRPKPRPDAAPSADDDAPGPPWMVDLAFDRVRLTADEQLAPFSVRAASDGARVVRAELAAGKAGEFTARIAPAGGGRHLTVRAADAGAVLRAADVTDNLQGGALRVDGDYADGQPGSPLSGTATLDRFQIRQAPMVGRLLQAATLYGLTDALRGPGLRFSRMVAPFRWQRRVVTLSGARAFSPSLGITAQGTVDLRGRTADLTGTVVPAYFFNQLLGNLPLVGRVFSPEKGGGVFAARYSVRGKLDDPEIGVNPLSALTPGFLREGFGLFSK